MMIVIKFLFFLYSVFFTGFLLADSQPCNEEYMSIIPLRKVAFKEVNILISKDWEYTQLFYKNYIEIINVPKYRL